MDSKQQLCEALERGKLAAWAKEIVIIKQRYTEAQLDRQTVMRIYDGSLEDHQTQLVQFQRTLFGWRLCGIR